MDSEDKKMLNWIKRLPKTEIHLHAEATVSFASYMHLNKKYQIDDKLVTVKDYQDRLNFSNLSDMIKFFLYLQSFFQQEEDFELLCDDIAKYAVQNRIYYLELFLSPSTLMKNGQLDLIKVLQILTKKFQELQAEKHITAKVIIDVSRTFGLDNAMKNMDMLLEYLEKYHDPTFIGIGLGGAEMSNSCVDYLPVFEKARKHNLHTVAHAGEEVGAESIWDALKVIGAERIGHGTSAMFDAELIAYLVEHQIPLEVCPLSNIVTKKYVSDIREHPIRKFFDAGVNVTLNTDDPVLFGTSLVKEYYSLYKYLGFTREELMQVLKNGLFATFLSADRKDRLWKKISSVN